MSHDDSNLSPGGSESAEDGRGEGAGGGVQISDQARGRSQEDVLTVQC